MNILYAGSYFYYKKNINKSIDNLSKLFDIKKKMFILVELKIFFY